MGRISLSILITIITMAGCTIDQSTGREAIEKGAVTLSSGFMFERSMLYRCYASLVIPTDALGSAEVVETPLEKNGYSSLILESQTSAIVLHTSPQSPQVTYCKFTSAQKMSKKTLPALAEFAAHILEDESSYFKPAL